MRITCPDLPVKESLRGAFRPTLNPVPPLREITFIAGTARRFCVPFSKPQPSVNLPSLRDPPPGFYELPEKPLLTFQAVETFFP